MSFLRYRDRRVKQIEEQLPQNTKRDMACVLSNDLGAWAESDSNVAFGAAGVGAVSKYVPGQIAIRAVKGAVGITEVFGLASTVETIGQGTINGFKSGDFGGAASAAFQEFASRLSGVDGLPGQLVGKAADQVVEKANFRNPCTAAGL
jgi:hypothetical protein